LPFYSYTAAENNGNLKKGEMEALDRGSVIDYLKSENLLVVSVKEAKSRFRKRYIFARKLSYIDKINFAENLGIMIKAGVNLNEALNVLSEESENLRFKTILSDLKFAIENGQNLSAGLEHYKDDFNDIFINMIKAGEASGKVEESLQRLSVQLKKEFSLISKIKNALIYPFVLIGGVVGVLILIITFVVPKLAAVFSGSSYKLPFTTKALFALSSVASRSPILTISVLVILVIGAALILRIKAVKKFFSNLIFRMLFRLPFASKLYRQIEMVRFSRTMGELLASGIPIAKALEITSSAVSLMAYQKLIFQAKEKIIKGVSLANAFRGKEEYFSGLLISVINVGEKTGNLAELLIGLADFYEEQTDNALKSMTSLIEPILLVIVGLLIGGMAISVVVPIYQLIGTF